MAKLAVCSKRNHFQTVCSSKDKAKSRNANCLDENEVYDDKSSNEDEKHTCSLSTKQSSKNNHFFFLKIKAQGTLQGEVRVCGYAVLRYFWRGFAEMFILACGIAVFQDQVDFRFYHSGKSRCAICGILLFFGAVLPFSELPLQHPTT